MNFQNFLSSNDSLWVIKDEKIIYKSKERGIAPLILAWKEFGEKLTGATVFDKVVGLAAAKILFFEKIANIETIVASQPAIEFLKKNQVKLKFQNFVANICKNDGNLCPMEQLALNKEPEQFVKLLLEK